MKTFRIFIILILILGTYSCEEFLQEENLAGASTEGYYQSYDGMETLITSCYATSKIFYGREEGFDFSVCGTDIYDYGQQHPQQYQYTFTSDFNPTNSRLVVLWVEFYKGLNACNDAIAVLKDPDLTPFDEILTKKRLSEVRFLRALYNWLVVETWGGVMLRDEPVKGVVKTATRSSVEDFYNLILSDLDFAVENLGDNDNTAETEYGRVNKLAALALRARMRLSWASQTNNNELAAQAAADAAAVIANGKFVLYNDYNDVWDINNNGMSNTENIWAINYSYGEFAKINTPAEEYTVYQRTGDKAWGEREGGHHGHLMFGTQYDVLPGFQRDLENGRPFRRYSPTMYLIDAYDETVDERFEGTFKTTWFSNTDSASLRWPISGYHTGDALDGKCILYLGDTGIFMYKGNFPDRDNVMKADVLNNYFWHIDRNFWCLDHAAMFNDDGTINDAGTNSRNMFFELRKFADPNRAAANSTGSERGGRDHMVLRLSEMYLTASEGYQRAGQLDNAYSYMLQLANARSKSGDGAAMLAAYGINSGSDLNIDFYLKERARELCGEQLRWFDLKRFGADKMIDQIKKYAGNTQARENFKLKFVLRPIPQVQIDALIDKTTFPQNDEY